MNYEAVIGLEIHVQLGTNSKMFCRCKVDPNADKPNLNVCPICMGYPGTLPVANAQAIDFGTKTAIALGCAINEIQRFDRKNYFYPDLPKGYQISQFFYPVGTSGKLSLKYLALDRKTVKDLTVGITRLHLEEDAGKLMHTEDGSLVDYNRCGTPLMEIVTEPDLRTPEDAKAFMQELQRIVRSLGVSDADMEKGQLRVDANVSVRPEGQAEFGSKVEVKNMNSFKFMEMALKHEIERQVAMVMAGERIPQETRGWNEKTNSTVSQRSKEESTDYRYFPDPDLPPINITPAKIEELSTQIGALPVHALEAALAWDLPVSRVFELQDVSKLDEVAQMVKDHAEWSPTLIVNWITKDFDKISREDFLTVVHDKKLSNAAANKLYESIKTGKEDLNTLAEGLVGGDEAETMEAVKVVLTEKADLVTQYKAGEEKVFGALMGAVMAKLQGRGDPATIKDMLIAELTK